MRTWHSEVNKKISNLIDSGITNFDEASENAKNDLISTAIKYEDQHARFECITELENSEDILHLVSKCITDIFDLDEIKISIVNKLKENVINWYSKPLSEEIEYRAQGAVL